MNSVAPGGRTHEGPYPHFSPMERSIELFRIDTGGFQLAARAEGEGRIESVILAGFVVTLAGIF